MSRYIEYDEEKDKYTENIESCKRCKMLIDGICCDKNSENLGKWGCDAENEQDEECFKKEDGKIEY